MAFNPRCRLLVAAVMMLLGSQQLVLAQEPASLPRPLAVLQVKRMCCGKESGPAIAELTKVPGVAKVVADHKAKTLSIIPSPSALPSPLALWEAAERSKVEPIRLSYGQKVYGSKPMR